MDCDSTGGISKSIPKSSLSSQAQDFKATKTALRLSHVQLSHGPTHPSSEIQLNPYPSFEVNDVLERP